MEGRALLELRDAHTAYDQDASQSRVVLRNCTLRGFIFQGFSLFFFKKTVCFYSVRLVNITVELERDNYD